jgi:xanthine dehydrogenase small subunit
LVNEGATQCGFCTPGIVVSLAGYLLSGEVNLSESGMKTALSGNLCRCTGYAAIKRAAMAVLKSLNAEFTRSDLVDRGILPDYFRTIPDRLRQLTPPNLEMVAKSPDWIGAGGTDLYVQQGEILADAEVRWLNREPGMKGITNRNGNLHLGALTTFAEFASHPAIVQLIPNIPVDIERIASWQIRHRATIGGNIVGASPIGDLSVLLLALEPLLILKQGENSRTLPLREFFHGYKDTAKQVGEILTEIIIPLPPPGTQVNFEKVSKRSHLDCAAVNSAIAVYCEGDIIRQIAISIGGVAPIPLFLRQTSAYFIDRRVTVETIRGAFPLLQQEISPLSDIYGAREYKRLLARQLLIAHFTELFPALVPGREFYATH